MYRKTYVEINLKNLEYNIKKLIKKYKDYQYHFGVVKADCYGHGIKSIATIIKAGCNYLAVATLDEALSIRKKNKKIPILCLGIIDIEYLDICLKNNITITISSYDYLKKINKKYHNLKMHIKVNTGMNRLGVNNRNDFNKIFNYISQNYILEGIYTHIYSPNNKKCTNNQWKKFEDITNDVDLLKIPIVHIGASEATEFYQKKSYANGCRLGISMYGLVDFPKMIFKSTFSLYSEVIQINEVTNETVGYDANYKAINSKKIAVVAIGYADGIIRQNTGREVYINNKEYKIVGNICMDMLFVEVDDTVKVGDKVAIIKDIDHIKKIANYLNTITYEVICSIGKRVPKIYN